MPSPRSSSSTDAADETAKQTFDELGNQLMQTDTLNHTTRYESDKLGRRVTRTLPQGMSETVGYDAAGRLQRKTDFAGQTTTFAYDTMGRLLGRMPDASFGQAAITYTYDVAGRRATMTDGTGASAYTYDARGRLLSKQTPQGTLSYTYNATGNLLTVRSSHAEGVSVDYTYDALNRLAAVVDNRQPVGANTTTYAYDEVGNMATTTMPNGVSTSYTYNSLNRLTDLTSAKGGSTVASYAYTLGAAGNRESVTEASGRAVNYTYDALFRLTGETITSDAATNGTLGYNYDAVGNRLQRTSTQPVIAPSTSSFDDNDRLTTDSYDANGSTKGSQGSSYEYDSEHRLTSVNDGAIAYTYDGDGNRVAKTVGGVTTKFLVDTNNLTGYAQVVEELQAGSVTRSYTYGHDLISQRQMIGGAWTTSFYGYDGHGSVRYLTDEAGSVTDTYSYDAFGTLISQAGTTPNDYLYAGERFDAETGMYYLRARYMQPGTGRFWTQDSFEGSSSDPLSLHKYTYASNDAVNRSDPSGHFGVTTAELHATLSINTILASNSAMILGSTQTAIATQVGATTLATLVGESVVASGTISAAAFIASLGVGITVANWNDSDRVVYRVLRPDEDPSLGLVAKDPYATKSPEEHVGEGSRPSFSSQ